MRNAAGLMLASVVSAVLIAGVWFWTTSRHAEVTAPQTVSAAQAERLTAQASAKHDDVEVTAAIPDKPPVSAPSKTACANPDALGVSRVVEIDTTGGPGFGFEHFKQLDFLADKEVVLTFDDGPWPANTPAVLKALAEQTRSVRIPLNQNSQLIKLARAETVLAQVLKRDPTDHEIGRLIEETPEQVRSSRQMSSTEVSLDAPIDRADREACTLGERFAGVDGQVALDHLRSLAKSRCVRRLDRLEPKVSEELLKQLQEMFKL